jgi:type II secretion system protein C
LRQINDRKLLIELTEFGLQLFPGDIADHGDVTMNGLASRSLSPAYNRFVFRGLVGTALVIPALVMAWLAGMEHRQQRLFASAAGNERHVNLPPWLGAPPVPENQWSVLASRTPSGDNSSADNRWRLAGTFFSFPDSGQSACKAVLDDISRNVQVLAAEGEMVDDMHILRIFSDHVIIRRNDREEALWLSFSGKRESVGAEAPPTSPVALNEKSDLEKSRYGTRVGGRRWIMNRDALMAYCEELRDDPERIAKLYVSMRPEYANDGSIEGSRIHMQGEQDFFEAMGLKEGDVVRKVNSLAMTSQARAEYFIQEFLQGRLSAVVLDIEREGQPEKMIYLIR